jgi:hypothetical protein
MTLIVRAMYQPYSMISRQSVEDAINTTNRFVIHRVESIEDNRTYSYDYAQSYRRLNRWAAKREREASFAIVAQCRHDNNELESD